MSMEQLKTDLARNVRALTGVAPVDLSAHLRDTLWPWLEAFLDEVSEIDDAVAELVDRAEDYLLPESAAIFANVISACAALAAELRKRTVGDAEMSANLDQADQIVQIAANKLAEITMLKVDEDEDEDEDEDDEEGDDE